MQNIQATNVEVHEHDVVHDLLPSRWFDLVHTRLVLMHLLEPEAVLSRLVSSLAPGGWILLEEHDAFPVTALADGAYARVWHALIVAAHRSGARSDWGRLLPQLLSAHGVVDVGSEAVVPLFPGGSANAQFWELSWQQVREKRLAGGFPPEELESALGDLKDRTQWFVGPTMVAAWGQKPSGNG